MKKIDKAVDETRTVEHPFTGSNRAMRRFAGQTKGATPKGASTLKLTPHWLPELVYNAFVKKWQEKFPNGEPIKEPKGVTYMTNKRRIEIYGRGRTNLTSAQFRRYSKKFNRGLKRDRASA